MCATMHLGLGRCINLVTSSAHDLRQQLEGVLTLIDNGVTQDTGWGEATAGVGSLRKHTDEDGQSDGEGCNVSKGGLTCTLFR